GWGVRGAGGGGGGRPGGASPAGGHDLVRGLAVVERSDEGLEDRDRPVHGAGVAPGLERMRLGPLPVAALGGLVLVEAEADAQRDLAERVLVHRRGEPEVGGGGGDRMSSERRP